ncbi:hypothetical protein M0R45_005040 [Rubus argutus]|uniref:NADH dehydrogenase subunit 6 n=1 Tax=Rubus argutus TaxID=59490 RepID=A0AAW1YM01_RUBAR
MVKAQIGSSAWKRAAASGPRTAWVSRRRREQAGGTAWLLSSFFFVSSSSIDLLFFLVVLSSSSFGFFFQVASAWLDELTAGILWTGLHLAAAEAAQGAVVMVWLLIWFFLCCVYDFSLHFCRFCLFLFFFSILPVLALIDGCEVVQGMVNGFDGRGEVMDVEAA